MHLEFPSLWSIDSQRTKAKTFDFQKNCVDKRKKKASLSTHPDQGLGHWEKLALVPIQIIGHNLPHPRCWSGENSSFREATNKRLQDTCLFHWGSFIESWVLGGLGWTQQTVLIFFSTVPRVQNVIHCSTADGSSQNMCNGLIVCTQASRGANKEKHI